MTQSKNKYSLSFTAASLRLSDFIKFADYFENFEGEIRATKVNADEVLGTGNKKSNQRIVAELVRRYNALTTEQKGLMTRGSFDAKKQISYLAIAKSNQFIRDFIIEIVREKALVYDLKLDYSDFNIFINRKIPTHQELEVFKESTMYKAKQTLFKILADAGIIDSTSSRQLQSQWLSEEVKMIIVKDNPEWLKLFLLDDLEIQKSLDNL